MKREGGGVRRGERPAQNKMRSHYVRSSKGARGLEQSACNGEHVDCVNASARALAHATPAIYLALFFLTLPFCTVCLNVCLNVCLCMCLCVYTMSMIFSLLISFCIGTIREIIECYATSCCIFSFLL